MDLLLAEVEIGIGELALDLIVDAAPDADSSGFGKLLQAGGDVHAVAVDRAAVGYDIAQVHAHSEGHVAVLGQRGILARQPLLHLDRALHRVDCAHELDQ